MTQSLYAQATEQNPQKVNVKRDACSTVVVVMLVRTFQVELYLQLSIFIVSLVL